jgi:hypothetical protein
MLKYIQTQRARIGSNTIETAIITIKELDRNTLNIAELLQEHTKTHYNKYALIPAEKLIAEYFSELLRLFHHKSSMPPTYSVPNLFVELTTAVIRELRVSPSIIVHTSIERTDIHDFVNLVERAFKVSMSSILNTDQKILPDRPVAPLTKHNLRGFTQRHSEIQSKIKSRKAKSQIITKPDDNDKLNIKIPAKYSSSSASPSPRSTKQETKDD